MVLSDSNKWQVFVNGTLLWPLIDVICVQGLLLARRDRCGTSDWLED